MAQTAAEYLEALETERDVLQAKLTAIASDGASYSLPGALVNSSGGVGSNHGEFYERWQKRLATINSEISELTDQDVLLREGRGTA